jgi:hypothetical protein
MTTPLTGNAMLANVLVRPSSSTDDTVCPSDCRPAATLEIG